MKNYKQEKFSAELFEFDYHAHKLDSQHALCWWKLWKFFEENEFFKNRR